MMAEKTQKNPAVSQEASGVKSAHVPPASRGGA